jgi:hypothetical protein
MHKVILIQVAAVSILSGCSDGGDRAAAGTTPKRAAELCNAYVESPAPAPDQETVVSAYKAGDISFDECMRRLRS